MKRIVTKIGDVFSVSIDNSYKKYVQYICTDIYQLNSSVIRAFKKKYPLDATPDIDEIIKDEVDFYAHTVLKWSIKRELWVKIGNTKEVGDIKNILFRDTSDYGTKKGEQPIKISDKWYVWRIGDKITTKVGKLEKENRKAEIGIIVTPLDVLQRLTTGKYNFVYPGFE